MKNKNNVSRETLKKDTQYMQIALKQAQKAYKKGEIPVGCAIVYKNKIIATAYNKKEKSKNSINHAEILCIKKACKKLKNWRLENCTIYVTMEPCMMCAGAIKESRISKIVYGMKNLNTGFSKYIKDIEIVEKICEKECKIIMQSFFKKIR